MAMETHFIAPLLSRAGADQNRRLGTIAKNQLAVVHDSNEEGWAPGACSPSYSLAIASLMVALKRLDFGDCASCKYSPLYTYRHRFVPEAANGVSGRRTTTSPSHTAASAGTQILFGISNGGSCSRTPVRRYKLSARPEGAGNAGATYTFEERACAQPSELDGAKRLVRGWKSDDACEFCSDPLTW